jgi:hypothetical protein
MRYTDKIINQNMKLLASLLLLGLIGFAVPTFAEPIVSSEGDVMTTILLTPDFEVDTSNFAETGEIILDVKFENFDNTFHGLKRVYESPYDENGLDDPDEVYEKYQQHRHFYIEINDITNEGFKLDSNQLIITAEDGFIQLNGKHERYDRFVVEILNIDELVPLTTSNIMKVETTFRLSSPELIPEHNYEIDIWAINSAQADPLSFTLPPSSPTPAPMEIPKDAEEAEILDNDKSETKEIPEWVKNIFGFYYKGEIGDEELIGALQYLIKEGIIEV